MYCNDQKEAFLFKRGGANNNYQSFQHRHLPTQQKPSDTYDKSKPSNSQTTQDDSEVISVSSDIHIKLHNTAQNFRAGKTGDSIAMWETMTTDQWILNTIKGYSVAITSTPKQVHVLCIFCK